MLAGSAHAVAHQVVERQPLARSDDQREHDVPAVAVRESLARRERRGMAAEHREVLLGRRELVRPGPASRSR